MVSTADNPVIAPDREVEEEKKPTPEPPRIRCPLCGRSPRKNDKWLRTCGMSGTRLILEESDLPACTSGLRLSAYPVADGRRIRCGMRTEGRTY